MKQIFMILILFQSFIALGQQKIYFNKDLPCINKEFNVFVHLVNNSNYEIVTRDNQPVTREMINEMLDNSNRVFKPICISFKLCDVDTVFNYNYNVITPENELKEMSVLYVGQNRINIYLVSGLIIHQRKRGLCLGTIDSMLNADIAINNMRHLPHELGHFFGLEDTFAGDRDELVDGSNCKTAGDKICDTPADPYSPYDHPGKYVRLRDCVTTYPQKDANGDYYQPDVTNYMSYYWGCRCRFSREQYLKMAENYFKATKKHW